MSKREWRQKECGAWGTGSPDEVGKKSSSLKQDWCHGERRKILHGREGRGGGKIKFRLYVEKTLPRGRLGSIQTEVRLGGG